MLILSIAAALLLSPVVINEVAWMGTELSYNHEWIELYNSSDSETNLEDWTLKAADGAPEIELAGTIKAKSFYLLERSDDNTLADLPADLIYKGALGNNGEKLDLFDNLGNLIDSLDHASDWRAGDNNTKQTMERKSSGDWQTSQNPGGTPRSPNSSEPELFLDLELEPGTTSAPATLPAIYPLGIIINEILPSPVGPDEKGEWIEIYNQNSFEVNLAGWQVEDVSGKPNVYTFPEKTKIGGQGFLVLLRPTTKITLNNSGDGLELLQPNGNVAASTSYEQAVQGESFNKTLTGWLWSSILTPGEENQLPVQSPQTEEKVVIQDKEVGLAAIGEAPLEKPKSLYLFLAALFTALFSGFIILVLKLRSGRVKTDSKDNL